MRSDVKGRRHVAAIGLALTVLLAACTGSGATHPATRPVTQAATGVPTGPGTAPRAGTLAPSAPPVAGGYDPAAVTWFSEPADVQPAAEEQHDAELGADRPGKLAGPEAAAASGDLSEPADVGASGPVPAGAAVLKAVDVCGLVPLADWRTWTGSPQAGATVTAPGEQCAYLEPADQARLRVSVSPPVPRVLGAADRAKADKLAGLDADAYWLPGTPTPFGSTLVVELPAADIVFEVFDRTPAHGADEVKAAATRWAAAAIGGLS